MTRGLDLAVADTVRETLWFSAYGGGRSYSEIELNPEYRYILEPGEALANRYRDDAVLHKFYRMVNLPPALSPSGSPPRVNCPVRQAGRVPHFAKVSGAFGTGTAVLARKQEGDTVLLRKTSVGAKLPARFAAFCGPGQASGGRRLRAVGALSPNWSRQVQVDHPRATALATAVQPV
jgi:hypothetical protein